jgi:hypothetical protein
MGMGENDLVVLEFLEKDVTRFIAKNLDMNKLHDDKKAFFSRAGLTFADEDLATTTIKVYIRAGVYADKKALERQLVENTYFRKHVHTKDRLELFELLENSKASLPEKFTPKKAIEVIALDRARIKAERTREFQLSNAAAELDERIIQKKKEYESLPSILDLPDPPPEPATAEKSTEFSLWWQDMNLTADPFATTDGLSRIPKELWDKIIVKSEIIRRYQSYLERDPATLFSKSTIVFGEFGSGKTALFEYLSKDLVNHKIYPLYILFWTEPDQFTIRHSFFRLVAEKLIDEYYKENATTPPVDPATEPYDAIRQLMKLLSTHDDRGFIIFVDGLNQGNNYPVILGFLRDLQAFKNNLNREGLKVGIFIAGALEWNNLIVKDSSLTGSIENREFMPVLTWKDALEMINKRFKAFSSSLQQPKTISPYFVEQTYKDLEIQKLPISYRSFIQAVHEKLRTGNYDIIENITTTPQLLDKIKSEIEEDPILSSRFENLIKSKGLRNIEILHKTIRTLLRLHLEGPFADDSGFVAENKFYLFYLKQAGLIVKAKKQDTMFWTICPQLDSLNKRVRTSYGRSMEDYLTQIYAVRQLKKNSQKKSDAIEGIEQMFDCYTELAHNTDLRESLQILGAVDNKLHSMESEITQEDIKNCWDGFCLLSKAYFAFENIFEEQDMLRNPVDFLWKQHPKRIKSVHEYIKRAQSAAITETDRRLTCGRFRDAYQEIVFELESILKRQIIGKDLRNLTNEELNELFEIENEWRKQDSDAYQAIIQRLCKLIQSKLRDFLFNVFNILYGTDETNWLEDRIDDKTRSYIRSNIAKMRISPFRPNKNPFYQLNRGNYRVFLTENNPWAMKNWREIFAYVLSGWSQTDLTEFLVREGESLIENEHDKHSTVDSKVYVRKFVEKAIEFLQKINTGYKHLIEYGLYYEGNKYYFSFAGYDLSEGNITLKDKKHLVPIDVADEKVRAQIKRIHENLEKQESDGEGLITINVVDGGTIYGVDYRIYIFYFAFLLQQSRLKLEEKDKPKVECNLIYSRGDKFIFSCTRK